MKTATLCAASGIDSSRTMGPAAVGPDLRTRVGPRRHGSAAVPNTIRTTDPTGAMACVREPPLTGLLLYLTEGGVAAGSGVLGQSGCLMPRSASAAITSRRCAAAAIASGLIVALCGCASYPPGRDFPKSQSEAVRLGPDSFLVSPFADALRSRSSESGFRILPVGVDGLLLRLELIERAPH